MAGTAKARRIPPPFVYLASISISLFLWLTSPTPVSLVQGCAAFLLLLAAWWSYWDWKQTGCRGLPLFAAVVAMYWIYFGLQLYWGDRHAMDWRHPFRQVTDAAVTQTMLLVVLGMSFLRFGIGSGIGRQLALKRLPELSEKHYAIDYVQVVAVASMLLGTSNISGSLANEGLSQIFEILMGTVPLVCIAILLERMLDGRSGFFEKVFLLGILAVVALLGVSSGWMGRFINLGLVGALVYLKKRNKLPVVAIFVLVPYALFFSAGKNEFRRSFWYGDLAEAGRIEKLQSWIDMSLQKWSGALNDPSGQRMRALTSGLLARTSLLSQAANVLEQTPDVVPYQYGRLYSYFAVALIPRFVWHDKPSMNEANQFYQVAYGLTPERDLSRISIAVGTLTEGYINFGWFGAAVMFLVGIVLDFWNVTFFSDGRAGTLAGAIGIALVPQLMAPEAQLAQLASGLVQHVVLAFLVFLPVIRLRVRVKTKLAETGAFRLSGGHTLMAGRWNSGVESFARRGRFPNQ